MDKSILNKIKELGHIKNICDDIISDYNFLQYTDNEKETYKSIKELKKDLIKAIKEIK